LGSWARSKTHVWYGRRETWGVEVAGHCCHALQIDNSFLTKSCEVLSCSLSFCSSVGFETPNSPHKIYSGLKIPILADRNCLIHLWQRFTTRIHVVQVTLLGGRIIKWKTWCLLSALELNWVGDSSITTLGCLTLEKLFDL
jgi:hypothetical protein